MQASFLQRVNRYTLGHAALVALAYFLVARVVMLFTLAPDPMSIFWLPSGIALAALVLGTRSEQPVLYVALGIASFAAHLTNGHTLPTSVGLAAMQLVESGVCAWVLARWASHPLRFEYLRDSVILVVVALLINPVTALGNTLMLISSQSHVLWDVWLGISFANGLGILLFAPVIIIWVRRGIYYQPFTAARLMEGAGILIATMALGLLVFSLKSDPLHGAILQPYLMIPLLVWFALRFSPRGTSVALLVVGVLGLVQTYIDSSDLGMFSPRAHWQIFSIQAFVAVTSGSVLVLSAVIAERVQAQRALQRYKLLVENSRDMILFVRRSDNRIIDANQAALDTFGYTQDEMIGMNISQLRPPDSRQEIPGLVRRADAGGVRYETINLCKDGTPVDVEISSRGVTIEGERVLFNIVRDISERKHAEHAQRQAEARYRALFEQTQDAVFLLDLEGNHLAANQRAADMLGYTHAEMQALSLNRTSAQVEESRKVLHRILAGEHMPPYERLFRKKDGTILPVEINVELIRDEQGNPSHLQSLARDISERKRTEQALIDSEKLYRSLVTVMPDGVALSDLNGTITYASPHLIAIHGGTVDTPVVGQSAFQWIAPEYHAKARANMQALLQNDQLVTDNHYTLLRQDGSRFEGEIDAAVLRDEQGRPYQMVTIHRDVTMRAAMESALRSSEEKFRKLFESAPDPTFLLDGDTGQFLDANPAALMQYGYTHQEILGLSAPDLSGEPEKSRASLKIHDTYVPLRWYRKKDGTLFPAELNISYLTLNNRPVRLSIVRDITDRKRAEDALRESESRYRLLFSEMLNGFALHEIICDATGMPHNYRFLEINPAFERMTGLRAETCVGKTVLEVLPGTESHWVHIYGRVALTGEPAHFESYSAPLDKYFEVTAFCPKRGQFATIFADVTSRRHAEIALRESEQQFRQILENVSLIAVRLDNRGDIVFCNDHMLTLTGWTRDEVIGKNWFDLFVPSDLSRQAQLRDHIAHGTSPVHYENEILTRAGKQRLISWSNTVARDSTGKVIGVTSIGEDVTERRQHELELEAIVRMNTALRPARTRDEMLPIILTQLTGLFNADGVILGLFDAQTGEGRIEQANGVWQSSKGRKTPAGKGISGHVFATRQPYITIKLADDPFMFHRDMIQDIASSVTMPLITANQVLGWIALGTRTQFASTDMRVLHAIADLIANALHRAALFDQANQSVMRLTALNMVDRTINASLDLRVTLNILLDQVIAQLNADATTLLLFNRRTQMLECRAERGFRYAHTLGSSTRLGNDVTSRAVLERGMVSLPDLAVASDSIARGNLLAREGFVSYHAVPLVSKGYVKGVLEVFHRAAFVPNESWIEFLRSLGEQAAIAVDNAELFTSLQRSNDELSVAYDATIEGWSRALDLRDRETEGHTLRVTEMTLRLARMMGLSDEELANVRRGALLHDIGKMAIADAILLKAGPLDPSEWEIMRLHPNYAYDLLSPITYLRPALHIPLCHHEKWDGSGYPRGLSGEQIPLHARMFAPVDVWDALSHDRPYRAAWPHEHVASYLAEQNGKHFDPTILAMFLKLLESLSD